MTLLEIVHVLLHVYLLKQLKMFFCDCFLLHNLKQSTLCIVLLFVFIVLSLYLITSYFCIRSKLLNMYDSPIQILLTTHTHTHRHTQI